MEKNTGGEGRTGNGFDGRWKPMEGAGLQLDEASFNRLLEGLPTLVEMPKNEGPDFVFEEDTPLIATGPFPQRFLEARAAAGVAPGGYRAPGRALWTCLFEEYWQVLKRVLTSIGKHTRVLDTQPARFGKCWKRTAVANVPRSLHG